MRVNLAAVRRTIAWWRGLTPRGKTRHEDLVKARAARKRAKGA